MCTFIFTLTLLYLKFVKSKKKKFNLKKYILFEGWMILFYNINIIIYDSNGFRTEIKRKLLYANILNMLTKNKKKIYLPQKTTRDF